jgi:hypothetical protein
VISQIPKSNKRYAADLIELARKDIQSLKDYTLSGTINHVYRDAADRGFAWATQGVEKMALHAMDRALTEWQRETKQNFGTMKALALVTAAQKHGYDLFGKALSFLRETLEIRNLGDADPKPYEAEIMNFFQGVINPSSWVRVRITLGGTDGGYAETTPPDQPGSNCYGIANRIGQLIIEAYNRPGSTRDGVMIQFL